MTAIGDPKSETIDRLWKSLGPYLEAEGIELDDLDIRGRGNGRIVRITVDAPGGVGVDRIAQLSRGMSHLLDEEDSVSGSYTLEVSSPASTRAISAVPSPRPATATPRSARPATASSSASTSTWTSRKIAPSTST